MDSIINVGLMCSKEYYPEHEKLCRLASKEEGWNSSDLTPWYQYQQRYNWKNPAIKDMELLSNNQDRKEYAAEIAKDVAGMWEQIKGVVLQSGTEG